MKTEHSNVTDLAGRVVPADVVVCERCSGMAFFCFMIRGQHQHIQCIACGESYCDGTCALSTELAKHNSVDR